MTDTVPCSCLVLMFTFRLQYRARVHTPPVHANATHECLSACSPARDVPCLLVPSPCHLSALCVCVCVCAHRSQRTMSSPLRQVRSCWQTTVCAVLMSSIRWTSRTRWRCTRPWSNRQSLSPRPESRCVVCTCVCVCVLARSARASVCAPGPGFVRVPGWLTESREKAEVCVRVCVCRLPSTRVPLSLPRPTPLEVVMTRPSRSSTTWHCHPHCCHGTCDTHTHTHTHTKMHTSAARELVHACCCHYVHNGSSMYARITQATECLSHCRRCWRSSSAQRCAELVEAFYKVYLCVCVSVCVCVCASYT